jgi:hypothetical protein
MLLASYGELLERSWQPVFAQGRSHHRALEHALAWPAVLGRRTIARTVWALGRCQQDWSADSKLFSRSDWPSQALFDPVLEDYLERLPKGPVAVAFDDTSLAKTGKKIPGTQYLRDPLSPPFHLNLRWGQRFLEAGLLFPHHRQGDWDARSWPLRFEEAPVVKKPGKRATEQDQQTYRELKKQPNLSVRALEMMRGLRAQLDDNGAADRTLLAAMDGSFCHRTVFKAELARTTLLARCRQDGRLCFPAPAGQRRQYQPTLFTPEQIRKDQQFPWKRALVRFAGKRRWIRYKQLLGVLWRRGAGTRPLRLIVIAPQPYRLSQHSRLNYRQPAYLLSTDTTGPVTPLIQAYFDRWQIEVNHRDEKTWLGVGQAPVRSPRSAPRHPTFVVACYSLLLLAGLKAFGPGRTSDFLSLPKWRKTAPRASLLDLLTLLRKDINETSVSQLLQANLLQNLIRHAHT